MLREEIDGPDFIENGADEAEEDEDEEQHQDLRVGHLIDS